MRIRFPTFPPSPLTSETSVQRFCRRSENVSISSKLILARERQPLAQFSWAVTSPSPRKRTRLTKVIGRWHYESRGPLPWDLATGKTETFLSPHPGMTADRHITSLHCCIRDNSVNGFDSETRNYCLHYLLICSSWTAFLMYT